MKNLLSQLTWRHAVNLLALVVVVWIGITTLSVIGRNYELQQEVDQLTQDIALLKLQNQELEFQIAYYQTDAFVDKEARDKLGLAGTGEQVVIFPDKIPQEPGAEKSTTTQKLPASPASNIEQWLYFLFKIEPRG